MRTLVLAGFAIAASLGIGLPLTGCDRLFNLQHVEQPPPPSTGKDNGYVCSCDCTYPDGGTSHVDLNVCAPGALNPNVAGGSEPTPEQLRDDCGSVRVQVQAQRMMRECTQSNTDCNCFVAGTAAVPEPKRFYSSTCDDPCTPRPLIKMNKVCTNWDNTNGLSNANCATDALCLDPGPVCLGPFGDLASGMMARVAQCNVDTGSLTVDVDGSMRTLGVGGDVTFLPVGCGPGNCVVPSYFFQSSGSMSFDSFLGLDEVSVRDIRSIGTGGALALDQSGAGQIPEDGSINSGRAIQKEVLLGYFEDTTQVAAIGGNDDPVDVTFDGQQCTIIGALAGGVGDPDGDNAGFTLNVNVSGTVVNTPPTADPGDDHTVECTDATGADVTLDASGSTDTENNIVHYGWSQGVRSADDIATGQTYTLHQPLGTETYFLKVIDAYMQGDQRDVQVTVADTTGPSIACNAPTSIVPRKTPYSFTATAGDTCGSISGAPTVARYECFTINSQGKRVSIKCKVQLSGGTFTVSNSGGIGDHFRWFVRATDSNGNTTEQTLPDGGHQARPRADVRHGSSRAAGARSHRLDSDPIVRAHAGGGFRHRRRADAPGLRAQGRARGTRLGDGNRRHAGRTAGGASQSRARAPGGISGGAARISHQSFRLRLVWRCARRRARHALADPSLARAVGECRGYRGAGAGVGARDRTHRLPSGG